MPKKPAHLTAAIEAAEAEIDDAAQARKAAAAHELALHYADAVAYATAQEEMSYYSTEEKRVIR